MRQIKVYISSNFSCTISSLVKILLVKFEVTLYSVCSNLNHEKRTSQLKCESWKNGGPCQVFGPLP